MFNDIATNNLAGSAPKYIPVINSLRGLASVIVYIYHLIWHPINFLEHTLIYELAPYGRLGVQVFFVITGVVIPIALINGKYNYRLFGKFMWKRIVRIEPPYLFSILTGILLIFLRNHLLSKSPHDLPTVKSLLLHLGYLIPFVKGENWFNVVYWTMAVEFQFYLLISLLFPLLIHKKIAVRVMSYCFTFASATIFTDVNFAPVWLPVFMMGIVYINFRSAKIKQAEFWVVLIASIGLSLFLHHLVITLVSVGTLAVIHFFCSYQSKLSNFFGDISYSLYLMHMVFGAATANFFVPHVSNFYVKLLVVLLAFIVSVISAYVFYLVIEKPSKKQASKILLTAKPKEVSVVREFPIGKELVARRSIV